MDMSVFDTEAAYHTSSNVPHTIDRVVRAPGTVLGIPSKATRHRVSDMVVSHSVVRKLGLMDRLQASDVTLLTATGRMVTPVGMLRELPIGVGSLRLPTDGRVIAADRHNVLVGNDFLHTASADICLSNNTLRLRMRPDQYEEFSISEASGQKRANMLTPFHAAGHVAIEEVDPAAPADAMQQHFTRLSELRKESIRQQEKSEADSRSRAALMGYFDSSIWSKP
ncbi:hypothetical protein ABBQ38_012246 [Trebouxia sp. C0009 RCD-2024]